MDANAAAKTVDHVSAVRRRVRRRLSSFWFPLLVFGGLTLGSLVIIALANGPALGVYWTVAGTVGGTATGRHYRRQERELGLEARQAASIVVCAAIVVGCLLAGGIAGGLEAERTAAIGPSLVVAAGYAIFAWLDRSAALAAIGALLGGLTLAVALSDLDATATAFVLALAYGVVGVVAGLVFRALEQRSL
ncbi:MAG: hypothetical protein MSC30_13035 [Gaiellaceae bacterium MAG52_C11]|nr:hypothetical protein [Candidatus Gaiellasilicea maunaloa]